MAAGYLAGNAWTGLRDFASKKSGWGEMEFLRFAFLSHACGELGEAVIADSNWRAAVDEAGNRFGPLVALLELAGQWKLKSERADLLWRSGVKFTWERLTWREM